MAHPSVSLPGPGRPTLLIQLPIPQLNFGRQTGNIPLAGGCLKMAADAAGAASVQLVPESRASYLGDAALIDHLLANEPSLVGFSVYAWNIDRSIYLAGELKMQHPIDIVFGGPEVTPDNARIRSAVVDGLVFGEGEAAFAAIATGGPIGPSSFIHSAVDASGTFGYNPYAADLMEPEIEDMVLVETQRGCPHRCGYCFYGKSRKRLSAVGADRVMNAVRWALDRRIGEVYLLDPCLNARQDLDRLLGSIARVNAAGRVRLISEIRAEAVDAALADRFAQAGFTWFEIGLQSTNPTALRIMHRPTDLRAFLDGVNHLKNRGISTGIDLIAGLPGDDPVGFSRTLDFVIDNGLTDDIQVFPLSILPGTPFRRRARDLGLRYDPHPPYLIVETPSFGPSAIAEALEQAQERCDLSLYPLPDLDLSGCGDTFLRTDASDIRTTSIAGVSVITKILINAVPDPASAASWARQVAHPYQIFFGPSMTDQTTIDRTIRCFTAANPFTPIELIFVAPSRPPDVSRCLAASRLRRPHYLDKDLTFLYPQAGNRTMLFTLLTTARRPFFQGAMMRQVHWWAESELPSLADARSLLDTDGIFFPDRFDLSRVRRWQDDTVPSHADLPAITFADPAAQKRWTRLTQAEDYWLEVLADH